MDRQRVWRWESLRAQQQEPLRVQAQWLARELVPVPESARGLRVLESV